MTAIDGGRGGAICNWSALANRSIATNETKQATPTEAQVISMLHVDKQAREHVAALRARTASGPETNGGRDA